MVPIRSKNEIPTFFDTVGRCSFLQRACTPPQVGNRILALRWGILGEQLTKDMPSFCSWGNTELREQLVKIGAKVTRHSKFVTFQLAEVAVTRNLFAAILNRIERLGLPPPIVAGCPA